MNSARNSEWLATADSDNVELMLAQVEVEYLSLAEALRNLVSGPAVDMADLRRQFDLFHNRIYLLRTEQAFEGIRSEAEFATALDTVWNTISRWIPFIDGPDRNLMAHAREMEAAFEAIHDDVRSVGLHGIDYFAERADSQREAAASALKRVAGLTLILIVVLAILVAVLWRLYRLAQSRAREVQSTSGRMSAIVSTAPDGVIVSDHRGTIREFNASAEHMFGYSRSEVLGRSVGDTIVPPHLRASHKAGMRRYAATGAHQIIGAGRVQLEAMRRSGEVFPVELSLAPSTDSTGEEIVVCFMRDITHRVAAEAELRAARDTARAGEKAKEKLLTVMSHEMRTPLNGMLGAMELLRDTELTEQQKRYADIIDRSGLTLLGHVEDVLDIARHDTDGIELRSAQIDIGEIIEDVVERHRAAIEAAETRLEITLPEMEDRQLEADPERLRQVLHGLVGNAAKFTRGGEIAVSASWLGNHEMLEITVADTGIGIADEDRGRIFEDFVTLDASYERENNGTGLGLGITRRLVSAMGGEIGVESEPGEGSLFWVRLPLRRPASQIVSDQTSGPDANTTYPSEPREILVVEDNDINRVIVREMLEKRGHNVHEAADGIEAADMASATPYDLILMDISMPRLDGIAATERIRTTSGSSADTPIVAVTAHALDEEIERFRAAGIDHTITKPVSRTSLEAALGFAGRSHGVQPHDIPAETPATDDLIDMFHIRTMAEDLGNASYAGLLDAFLDETDRKIAALTVESDPARDTDGTVARLHELAGSSAMFGAKALRTELARLERCGKRGDIAAIRAGLGDVARLWADSRSRLFEIRGELRQR